MYEVKTNEFHGGALVSNHRSLEAALKVINNNYKTTDCKCGICFDLFKDAEKIKLEVIQNDSNFGYEIVVY